MANTVIVTNRTIEVTDIDSNYMMDTALNVESVVFIPAAWGDTVDIIENSIESTDPVKVRLYSILGVPKVMYFNQRLQLGFIFANGTFTADSKVVFNIGEIN